MIVWTKADAVALNAYLNNPNGQGQRFMAYLRQLRPSLGGSTIEEKALTASVAEGAEKMIEAIPALAAYDEGKRQPSPFVSVRDSAPKAAMRQREQRE